MRPFRAPRLIVKETEEGNLESSLDKSDKAVRQKHLVPELETQNLDAASPNVLEFELYLDGLASKGDSTMASPCKAVPEKNLVSELETQNFGAASAHVLLEFEFYLDGPTSKEDSTMASPCTAAPGKNLVSELETQNVGAASSNVLDLDLHLDRQASKVDSTMASPCTAVPQINLVSELEIHNVAAASPNVMEFETFLDGLSSKGASRRASPFKASNVKPTTLPLTKPAHMSNDEWWDTVLQSEQQRLKVMDDELNTDAVSSDDDIPIVQTLPVATTQSTKKKKVKTLWSYETVMEPTGARSKYWDSPAPIHRAQKELAKQKLQEMKNGEEFLEGASNI